MGRNKLFFSLIFLLFLILAACSSGYQKQKETIKLAINEEQGNNYLNNNSFNGTSCSIDTDCKIIYGCDCGCYNKEYQQFQDNITECKCLAPSSCECIKNSCKDAGE